MTLDVPILRKHNLSTFKRFVADTRITPTALTHIPVCGDIMLYSVHENGANHRDVSLRLHHGSNKVRNFLCPPSTINLMTDSAILIICSPFFCMMLYYQCCLCSSNYLGAPFFLYIEQGQSFFSLDSPKPSLTSCSYIKYFPANAYLV